MKATTELKPIEVCPAFKPVITLFLLIGLGAIILGWVGKSLLIALWGLGYCLFFSLLFWLFSYPRIIASTEGLSIQRKWRGNLELLPWTQFQCMYTFRQGMTYRYCGLLFTTEPLTKEQQLTVAKACQHGKFHPILTHDGHMWVGCSLLYRDELYTRMPSHIQQMPENACANVNMRFTKLI